MLFLELFISPYLLDKTAIIKIAKQNTPINNIITPSPQPLLFNLNILSPTNILLHCLLFFNTKKDSNAILFH